jgi:heat shock protein HslJ
MLAALTLVAALAAVPATAHGQTEHGQAEESASDAPAPLALAPDGQLPLLGTPWRLRRYRWRGVDREPGPEVAAWMRLGPADLQGSGGCTKIRGRHGAVGSAIRFDLRSGPEPACAEQTTIVQLGMIDGLRRTASYEILPGSTPAGDQLVLRDASGSELLRFGLDDIGGLEAGEWQLLGYTVDGTEIAAVPDQPAVLTFRAKRANAARRTSSGPITGSTGCNGLVAEFYRHANVVSFGEIGRTDAPCMPALAAQEEAMFSILDASSLSVALPPDRLVLTSADTGERLEFTPSRPVEGSTWLLTKLAGEPRSRETVTLLLRDGLATGIGPCGPYSARYASDGYFVTFSDVKGAGDQTCAALSTETALLDALRTAVRHERQGSQLRLVDARGKVRARFKPPTGP